MPDNQINLTIKLNAGDAGKIIEQLSSKVLGLGGNVKLTNGGLATFDDFATKIGFRLQGIGNIINALKSTFGDWIQESNAGEASTAKLVQSLKNQGVYSEALLKDIKQYADERKMATGIDEDATVSVAAQLTAMGLHGKALKDAIAATQDLSTLMDGDMQGAVRVVADAFSGNASMLGRYVKGLDETDIKQRGTISIVEQMQKAFGGQAEAMGNTGAGAVKKYEVAIDDLKKTFGSFLKEALMPILDIATSFMNAVNESGESAKVVAMGITSLGVAYAFLNTSAGGLPYILLGSVAGIVTLVTAIKEGSPYLSTAIGFIGGMALALLALNAKSILASIGLLTNLLPSMGAIIVEGEGFIVTVGGMTLAITFFQAASILLLAGIVALGVEIYTYNKRGDEIAANLRRQRDEGYKTAIGLDDLRDKVQKLTEAELQWGRTNAITQLSLLNDKLITLSGNSDKASKAQQEQIRSQMKAWEDYIAVVDNEEAARGVLTKKMQEESSAAYIEVQKRRAEVERVGITQSKELENVAYKEELNKIKEQLRNKEILQGQADELTRLAKESHTKKLRQIDLDATAANEKLNDDQMIANLNRAKEELQNEYNNAEKIKTNAATTDEAKAKIADEYAKKRIILEADTTVTILELQRKIVNAELAAARNSGDEQKVKELKAQVGQLNKDIASAQKTASLKTTGVDIDRSGESAARKKEVDAENAAFKEEEKINADKVKNQKQTTTSLLDLNNKLSAANKKYADDRAKYLASTDKDDRSKLKSQLERDKEEIDSIHGKIDERQQEVQAGIESGMQEYDANESLGQQINKQANQSIRAYIAEAVMSYVKSIVASTGPLALFIAPAAGLVLQAALEAMIPKFGTGGGIKGKRHSEGGTLIEAEDGEFIVRRDVAQRNLDFLNALNAGLVTIPTAASGGVVNTVVAASSTNSGSGFSSLKKEFASLKKAIKNMPAPVIVSQTDWQKYDKLDKELAKRRVATAL